MIPIILFGRRLKVATTIISPTTTNTISSSFYSTKISHFKLPSRRKNIQEVITDFDRKYSLMSDRERYKVSQELKKLNQKDWSSLSLEDKRACILLFELINY